jgi:alpha-D-ribose 1-methylphosphonate 5-triphosphate synthase subunit PhnI
MAFVAAARPGAILILRRFRWPPRLLAAAALSGADVGAPRRVLALWLRLPGARRLFHRLLSVTILASA